MKKLYLIFSLSLNFIAVALFAQCPPNNDPFGSSSAPTVLGQETTLATCIFGGEYYMLTGMQAGNTYQIETCGDTDFDTQLTIFPAAGGAAVAYNDDYCGFQSRIDFIPPSTGDYHVQVNQFNCTTNQTCMTLKATLINIGNSNDVNMQNGTFSQCDGTFRDSGGTGNYSNNEFITTTICPDVPGTVTEVSFSFFDIESGFDDLTIYDGSSTGSPQIGVFTGTTSPGTVTSTDASGCLTFVFDSDFSVTDVGWEATISCIASCVDSDGDGYDDIACGGTDCDDSDSSINPGATEVYCNGIDENCNGSSDDVPDILMPTGVGSSGSIVTCCGTFTDHNGSNANYSNNQRAVYTICPDTPGDLVEVTFSSFHIEAGFDSLLVINGNYYSGNPGPNQNIMGVYWGTNNPGTVTSTHATGCLTFYFSADGSVREAGWEATISCVAPCFDLDGDGYDDIACGGTDCDDNDSSLNPGASEIYCNGIDENCNGSSDDVPDILMPTGVGSSGSIVTCCGTFTDHNGSNANYSNNQRAVYTICPDTPGDLVEVTFSSFHIEAGFDSLLVINGNYYSGNPGPNQNIMGVYWGTNNPGTVTSSHATGCLTFYFSADGSVREAGWEATISCVAPCFDLDGDGYDDIACGGTDCDDNDSSINPGASEIYCNGIDENCNGSSDDVPDILMPTGVGSSGSIVTCCGTFTDHNGSNANYSNNQRAVYTICPDTPGDLVEVTFSSFHIEAGFDSLLVINGNYYSGNPGPNQNIMGVYWGTNNPGTVTSSHPTGCLTFYFSADGSVREAGWEATISCVTPCVDSDGDGYEDIACGGTDCDDSDSSINPGATEIYCNGIDENCNGSSDDVPDILMPTGVGSSGSIVTCCGTFTDHNGSNANYSNNQRAVYTICPDTPGDLVEVTFSSFHIEAGFDSLLVINGNYYSGNPGPNQNIMGVYWGTNNPGTVTSSHPTGCLTIYFSADGSITYSGWEATISCVANMPPTAICKNLNLDADGNCEANADAIDFDGGSYDPDGDPLTYSVSPAGPYPLGTTNVVLTVTDPNGISDTCPATVTVTDVTPPVIGVNNSSFVNPGSVSIPGSFNSELGCAGDWEPWCPNIELGYDADDQVWQGTFNIPGGSWEYKAALDDSWSENYGLGGTYFGPNIPLNLGGPANVKFYYDPNTNWITDNVNSRIVVAAGDFQSEIGCPADWEPWCLRSWLQDPDGDGIYEKSITGIPAGNYEVKAAINESWAENYGAGGVYHGANIPFSVPDDNSIVIFTFNTYTNVLDVTTVANEACPDPIEITTSDGACFGIAPDFLSLIDAYDNCGVILMTQSPGVGNPVGVGTHTVTLTAYDAAGLTASCQTSLTVYDYTPPTAVCQNTTIQLNAEGVATLTPGQINGGSHDACGIDYLDVSQSTFNCGQKGENTVTLLVWDNNGNLGVCDATVTVEDNIDPAIYCSDPITVENDPGQCGANVPFGIGIWDNCPDDLTVVCTIGGDDGGGSSGNCATNNVDLSITFDNYPEETSWAIMNSMDQVIESGGPYPSQPDGSTLDLSFNLPDGDYMFVMYDSFEDGICCSYGNGSYTLSSDGNLIVSGGVFTDADKTTFCVEAPSTGGMPLTEVQTGDFFPVGTTTVTCTVTDGSGNTDVCSFDITVNDTEAPMIDTPCPDNITLCGAQEVYWTPPTATDNCAVVSTVSNYNPGDFFDVGTYTVTYTFYDKAGLSVSCSFIITIHPVPEVEITQADLPLWCQGIQVLTANVLNPGALTYPLTFEWSNGLPDDPVVIAPANGTYFVTVTDALGCATTVSTVVDEDISSLFSAYTIISGEEFEMYASDVIGGGVGIEDADEGEIALNSNIFTFLRADADHIQVDGTSFINDFIDADFDIDFPPFQSNPNNVVTTLTVPANTTMTLSNSIYGYVNVESGATLIIDNSTMYMQNLVTAKDVAILFTQPTELMVRRRMSIGETNTVNPDGHTCVVYVGDEASVNQGSVVTLNIYSPEGLEVNDSGATMTTFMTGIFISNDRVFSDHNVVWNWNLNCSYLPTGDVLPMAQAVNNGETLPEVSMDKPNLNVYPNPTSGVINVDVEVFLGQQVEYIVYDSFGKEIMRKVIDHLELPVISVDMSPAQFANGMYQMSLRGGDEMRTVRFILSK